MSAERVTFQDIFDYLLIKLKLTTSTLSGSPYSVEKLCTVINLAMDHAALHLIDKGDQFINTTASANLVSSQEVYTIGPSGDFDVDDYLQARQFLTVESSGEEHPVEQISITDRYRYVRSDQNVPNVAALKFYFTTGSITNSSVKYPAIGLVPQPTSALVSGLKMHYYFKPQPITHEGDTITNPNDYLDIPERAIPFFKSLAERLCLEIERSQEKINMMEARLAREENQATSAITEQKENSPVLMEEWPDPAVDY